MLIQASAVEIEGRAAILEGPPGSGKSSLALSLIDRGARLIGDDGVMLAREGGRLVASPPPNITGLLEIRGVGLVNLPTVADAPVALVLSLVGVGHAERLPGMLVTRDYLGMSIPVLPFVPGDKAPAVRAEWALRIHGLAVG
ncbi:HPr kinase/phosphorylase [Erythrobacter dokdonensis]|uniref:HPr protein serine kinase n=1 Tax=Erythrobacter dokdonensis DSW-74 TaxID=1300349 RepID=A0A1A7BIY6_9SPHN|nr:HPr kinase/phosphatase C-terminal domain-containing protein [Erythrobacter dokdonensis]OBV11412.1 HPr protein serine kinase [Erythrobacter dokdonensis DSW-74]